MIRRIAAGAALALALAACGGSGSSQPPLTATHAVQATASPSAAMIAGRLKAAGLPVDGLITYTAVTDPNHLLGRQNGYASKVAWSDPRAAQQDAGDERGSIQLGGGIEVFPAVAAARARYQYLKGFTPPLGDGYDYLDGTAVLRLSQYLTPAQASAYAAAFRAALS